MGKTPGWATPCPTRQAATRSVPIRLSSDDISRADIIAKKTKQSRSALLKRIVTDALYSPDADTVISR